MQIENYEKMQIEGKDVQCKSKRDNNESNTSRK
jgi:hypothetical protein